MSSKERLCTHCGRFIEHDDAVRPCVEGGFAHSGCEHTDYGDWHGTDSVPTEQDERDYLSMLEDESREQDDHR
ncbi:MAG: hypothetical protein ACOYB3_01950 [Azonexus sp.]